MNKYQKIYNKAAKELNAIGGCYGGFSGVNALTIYVREKYNINACLCTDALDALHNAKKLLDK